MQKLVIEIPGTVRKTISPIAVLDVHLAAGPTQLYVAIYDEEGHDSRSESLTADGKALGAFLQPLLSQFAKDGFLDALTTWRPR